ncbi:MAG: methionine synthase [Spirochaetales bacterium]|nr:MAG: methionine synthase [Spirochaetales bacterium]
MKKDLISAIAEMNEQEALKMAALMLENVTDPHEVLNAATEAMALIGERYDHGEYFLPELLLAGEIMKQIGELVKPKLAGAAVKRKPLGIVVIGTVSGDIHDIGKDVVSFILEVNNFEVHNLGVDVPASKFVEKIKEVNAQIVGMSGLLTPAFDQMKKTVDAIKEAGLREKVKIMIGGAVMSDEVAKYSGADAYGKDATSAFKLAKSWIGGK